MKTLVILMTSVFVLACSTEASKNDKKSSEEAGLSYEKTAVILANTLSGSDKDVKEGKALALANSLGSSLEEREQIQKNSLLETVKGDGEFFNESELIETCSGVVGIDIETGVETQEYEEKCDIEVPVFVCGKAEAGSQPGEGMRSAEFANDDISEISDANDGNQIGANLCEIHGFEEPVDLEAKSGVELLREVLVTLLALYDDNQDGLISPEERTNAVKDIIVAVLAQ